MNNIFSDLFSKYDSIVFFDVETTGLDPKTCQIIELAAIKLEKTKDGIKGSKADMYVKLPDGEKLPEKIVELTGITDEILLEKGRSENCMAKTFVSAIDKPKTLLVAHNAHFDLSFIRETLKRSYPVGNVFLDACDYLDSLTVFKDRRAYPHRLENAVSDYGLEDKVESFHLAINDVKALIEVCIAMDRERSDLTEYVNIFGFNPKYGVSGDRLSKVAYLPQSFHDYMTSPEQTLPEIHKEKIMENTYLQNRKRRI